MNFLPNTLLFNWLITSKAMPSKRSMLHWKKCLRISIFCLNDLRKLEIDHSCDHLDCPTTKSRILPGNSTFSWGSEWAKELSWEMRSNSSQAVSP